MIERLHYSESLAEALHNQVKEMREKLGELNISRMRLDIEATGQTLSGDLMIEYKLSEDMYGDAVKGGSLQPVFEEFIRRKGWSERNQPVCLPRVDDTIV